ncbi:hypothetical protein EVAR_99254_1 [Eumeta japonica]|uniref:Uncharacterized protein n=1 Tax=Eumeta variegata TaxID=151549 RepID=A0A4C2A1X4_EUMVA|nr:hypothetical protein EVAR_99254_1 [Eumeta japonica]
MASSPGRDCGRAGVTHGTPDCSAICHAGERTSRGQYRIGNSSFEPIKYVRKLAYLVQQVRFDSKPPDQTVPGVLEFDPGEVIAFITMRRVCSTRVDIAFHAPQNTKAPHIFHRPIWVSIGNDSERLRRKHGTSSGERYEVACMDTLNGPLPDLLGADPWRLRNTARNAGQTDQHD